MAFCTLTMPDWLPTALNQLTRRKRQMRIRLGKEDRQILGAYAYVEGIPRATGKRRVSARFTYRAKDQMADVDAFFQVHP